MAENLILQLEEETLTSATIHDPQPVPRVREALFNELGDLLEQNQKRKFLLKRPVSYAMDGPNTYFIKYKIGK